MLKPVLMVAVWKRLLQKPLLVGTSGLFTAAIYAPINVHVCHLYRETLDSNWLVFQHRYTYIISHTVWTITVIRYFNFKLRLAAMSWGSSASVVSDHAMGDRTSIPTSGEVFFICGFFVQAGSGAHLFSFPMATEDPFLGGKARQKRDADNSLPHLVLRSRTSTFSSPKHLYGVWPDILIVSIGRVK
jgi:hypothetical protein